MSYATIAVALCAIGAEKTVSNEIRKAGLSVLESAFGRVRFECGLAGLYRALMGLRAADRVLLEVAAFEAAAFDDLFEGAAAVPWEDFIPRQLGIRVAKVRTNRSQLGAETSIQAVVHKAVAARLCAKRKIARLPETAEDAELRIYIEKDKVSVLLDLSGEPLFKRGYRTQGGAAPLRETTAAAIIISSLWRRKFPLYDPFCGSGTIAIEAAMFAWDIAPGLGRRFAIERLLFACKDTERLVREELLARVDFSRQVRICGSDLAGEAVGAARANIERAIAIVKNAHTGAGAAKCPVRFQTLPLREAAPPEGFSDSGFIITNPPYGQRLGDVESAEKNYAEMACLAESFAGWKLALITTHAGFESFFGRKADLCREISNGAATSYFYLYEAL